MWNGAEFDRSKSVDPIDVISKRNRFLRSLVGNSFV